MEKKGILICIISAFCFSLGPITGKLLFSAGLPWQVVVSLRCMIPAMLILIYSLCFSREVFQIQKKHLPLFILDGASFSLFSVCNYCALYYIDAAVATVLVYTLPVFTVIFSRIILKEAFTAPKIIAMIMVFCGVLFIIEVFNISSLAVSDGTKVLGIPSSIFGILIGIMSGVLSAFYTIFTKKLNQYYSGWTVNCWCFFAGFPIFLIVGFREIAAFSWSGFSLASVLAIAMIGFAAYSLYVLSMQYIDAGKASLFVALDPVFSVTMAIFILGEHLTIFQFIGCVLVLGGIIFIEKGYLVLNFLRSKKIG